MVGAQIRYLIHADRGVIGAVGFGAAATTAATGTPGDQADLALPAAAGCTQAPLRAFVFGGGSGMSDLVGADRNPIENHPLEEEIHGVDPGDERRDRRACAVIEQLERQPRNSTPTAIGGWGETRSADHMLAHEQVTAQKVLAPHYQSTLERIEQHPVV
ncbi:MAG: hypothetical protein LJE91_15295 [Gammaproteobacteria bacterium]|jgi:hypothetical protein|nr:hypothetical protein [Gammaproteobacteria bacterium]